MDLEKEAYEAWNKTYYSKENPFISSFLDVVALLVADQTRVAFQAGWEAAEKAEARAD